MAAMIRWRAPDLRSRSAAAVTGRALLVGLGVAGCFVDTPGATTAPTSTTGEATTTTTGGETTEADPVICGDFDLDPGEACDLGTQNGDGGLCKADCTFNTCGDGYLGPGEACDDGNRSDADACSNACAVAVCGDGLMQIGEGCDDGNAIDGDGCTACALDSCGDGVQDPGEGCDDGNDVADDACTDACTLPACGDGIIQGAEACDDGVKNADDGLCSLVCVAAACGDGVVQRGEECDDGNLLSDDGCSKVCTRDAVFVFVTKSAHSGALGGLLGADLRCQQEADAAGLPGDYLAWLADDQGSPSTRFAKSTLPYRRTDGALFALDWALLISAGALVPLNVAADGEPAGEGGGGCLVGNTVWTNTNSKGEAQDLAAHCSGWKAAVDAGSSLLGRTDLMGLGWTNGLCNGYCEDVRRLFCFGQ